MKDREKKFKSLLIFGPPGSGKGTLSKVLAGAGNLFHLSSGEIFRGLSPDSPAGKLFHSYANRGHLVPDEVVLEVWKEHMQGLIAKGLYQPEHQVLMLDGVPRTLEQAKMFDAYIEVVGIILLEVKHVDTLIQRLQKRALIENRLDDAKLEVLSTRMQVYENQTAHLLHHYPKQLVHPFNAEQKPLEVLRDVLIQLCPLLIH